MRVQRAMPGLPHLLPNLLAVRKWLRTQHYEVVTLTDQATIAWDLDIAPVALVTLGGNRLLTVSNIRNGAVYILFVLQDGTGSRTLSYSSDFLFAGGNLPVLSTGAGAEDILTFIPRASKLRGGQFGAGFA
jgi:hypothetical protein